MLRSLLLLASATFLASSAVAQTCTTSWQPDDGGVWTSGDWSDADRWDNGVPTASNTACIFGAGTRGFTVTVGAPATVGGLVVGSTTASLALQLDAALTVRGDGRLFGDDAIDGDLTLGGTFEVENGRLITNGGTVTVRDGGALVVVQSGGNNGNGGATSVGDISGTSETLRLESGGRLEVRESVYPYVRLEVDGGTIAVREDDREGNSTFVRFRGDGSLDDLTLDTDVGTTLTLQGVYTASGVIGGTADGVAELSRFSTLAVDVGGAEFAVGGDLGFALSNNDSGSSSELAVTTAGGEILNSGLLRFPRRIDIDGVTIRSTGTLRVDGAGGADLLNGSQLVIEEAGTLLFTDALRTGNRSIYGNAFNDPGDARITLRGRIVEEGNGASDGIYVPVDVDGGEIAVVTGRLDLRAGGTLVNPTLRGEAGAELQLFGAWDLEGTVSGESAATPGPFEDDVSVVFAGSSRDTPTTFRAIGEVVFDIDGAGIELGVSGGTTILTAAPGGRFVNRSAILQKGSAPFLRAVTLRNEGEVLGGGFRFEEGAQFVNASGAVAGFRSGVVSDDGTGAFVNEGLVQSYANGSFLSFRGLLDSRPGSELRVGQFSGASVEGINLSQENPASYGAGVTVSGEGRLSWLFGTRLQGTISPGTPEAPFDTLGAPDLQFSETEGDPRFVVDIGDGVSDIVNTGDAGILAPGGATLVVRVAPGFTPTPGDQWVVARRFSNSAGPTGAFPVIEVEGAPPGITFVQDPEARGAIVVRAVAQSVTVAAREAEIAEGAVGAFVLRHAASPSPYTVTVELAGTATPFADYTLGATRGAVRVRANTTQTLVSVFARRDANTAEGTETVTLRLGGGAAGAATLTITDGPSSDALAVDGISPARGSTAGQVTAGVYGTGFGESASVRLVGPGTVDGADVALTDAGALAATFDLRGAAPGTYGVEVTSGGTARLAGAFTVADEAPSATPPVWAAITGTPNPRRGRFSTYTITVGNDGPVDLFDVAVPIRITEEVEYEILGIEPVPGVEGRPLGLDTGEQISTGAYFYVLPAGSAYEIRVRLRPTRSGQEVGVGFEVFPPNPDALYTYSGDPDDFAADLAAERWTNWAFLAGAVVAFSDRAARTASGPSAHRAGNNPPWCPAPPIRPPDSGDDDDLITFANDFGAPPPPPPSPPARPFDFEGSMRSLQSSMSGIQNATNAVNNAVRSMHNVSTSVARNIRGRMHPADVQLRAELATGGPGDCGGGVTVGSFDPNDKLGPVGASEGNHYRPDGAAFPYTVRFENIDTATAPAQEVVVTDSLDTSVFDLSTFRFGPVTFGEAGRIVPPAGPARFEATVDLSDPALGGLDATLLVTGALDAESGVVTWRFATLDPDSGDLPEDALVGFLPPNASSPEGEGAVSFTVKTFEGLPSGTVIANDARIVFDVNAPIDTPVWTNTVDLSPPTSRVDALTSASQAPFEITVSGSDAGAGIGTYALFVQRDGGAFELAELSDEPTFTFDPEAPGTYGFYARATDAVGNVESSKDKAEATTTVAVDGEAGPDLPSALTVERPFPNPARGVVEVRVGLPAPGPTRVAVYDVRGREVAVLADGERPAGWRVERWDASGAAPGVYVLRVQAGDAARMQRIVVVR